MPSSTSIFSLFTAGLAAFAPIASAWTQPQGDSPDGNPIYTPGLHEVVPAGQAYNITWKPTTDGKVDLVLLKGPSDNAVPQYAIAEGIDNTGSYSWTPSSDLKPTGDEGYGIELIDNASGKFQYSTQFGIANDNSPAQYDSGVASASASWSSSAAAATSTSASTASAPSSTTVSASSVSAAATTSVAGYSSTIVAASSTFKSSYVASGAARPTGGAYGNSTSTGPSSPHFTNGAASSAGSFLGAAIAAGFVAMMM